MPGKSRVPREKKRPPAAGPEAPGWMTADGAYWCGFAGIMALFLTLKAYGLNRAVGDEGIYFYDSLMWSMGKMPYRDFFFAHPPLHIAPLALVFLFTGYSFMAAKLLPVFSTALVGVFIFIAGKRRFGRPEGLLAAAFFLIAYDVLRASSHFTGVDESVCWMAAGMLCALGGRFLLSGVFYALGAATGFYVFPGALMALTMSFFTSRKGGLRFTAGFAVPIILVNAAFWAVGGSGFIDGVYRYHFLKPEMGEAEASMWWQVIFHNFWLFAGSAMAIVAVLPETAGVLRGARGIFGWPSALLRSGRAGAVWWLAAYTAGYLVFLAMLSRIYHFYFLLAFPSMALLAGYAVWETAKGATALAVGFFTSKAGSPAAANPFVTAILVLSVLIGLLARPSLEEKLSYFAGSKGTTSHYRWNPSLLPGPVDAAVKAVFWKDARTIGKSYSGVRYYLWHESRVFRAAEKIARYVRENSADDETVFGDSTSAPLIALMAGRGISEDFTDTNTMRFRSGITPAEDCIRQVDTPKLRFVIAAPGKGFFLLPEFQKWVAERFTLERTFDDRTHGRYNLYKKKN